MDSNIAERIREERERHPTEWAGAPDIEVEVGLFGLNGVRTEVLQYVLIRRAAANGSALQLVYR